MKNFAILTAAIALIPAAAAFASEGVSSSTATTQSNTHGAGSGQPGIWGQAGLSSNSPMRPNSKSTQQNVNHTNVHSTNASSSPNPNVINQNSSSSGKTPDATIKTTREVRKDDSKHILK